MATWGRFSVMIAHQNTVGNKQGLVLKKSAYTATRLSLSCPHLRSFTTALSSMITHRAEQTCKLLEGNQRNFLTFQWLIPQSMPHTWCNGKYALSSLDRAWTRFMNGTHKQDCLTIILNASPIQRSIHFIFLYLPPFSQVFSFYKHLVWDAKMIKEMAQQVSYLGLLKPFGM